MFRILQTPRRLLALSAIPVLLITALLAASATAAATTSRHAPAVTPAATACYSAGEASEHLDGANVTVLKKLLPCLTRSARPASAGFSVSALLSREGAIFLKKDQSIPVHDAAREQAVVVNPYARAFCKGRAYRFANLFGDSSPPPVLTPAVLAKEIKSQVRAEPILVEPGTEYGFAYDKHVLYKGEKTTPDPVGFALIAYKCL